MHFKPSSTAKSDRVKRIDLFDELLGIARSSKPTQNPSSLSSSRNVEVKLEFDDATIDTEAAAAYLARFRHHIEYPNQLVFGSQH